MRNTFKRWLSDTATVERQVQTDTNELGEPITETVTVADDVACALNDEGTEFVREESGDRVSRPATVRFANDVDIEEGDTVTIDGEPEAFEVRGVQRRRDTRRGVTVGVTVEVERNG